jgi:hypothetical protein
VKPLEQTGLLVCKRRQSRPETEVPVEVLGKRLGQTGQPVGRVYRHRQSRPEIEVLVEELGKRLEQTGQLEYKLRQNKPEIEVLVQSR